jgi:ubiquitin-conjugating enzyme E2 J1
MASPFNTKSPTIKRILREAAELSSSPSADYHAAPLDTNLFEWHFTLRGPPAPSPFAGGIYHGRIVLPPTYPLRPPSFRFLTPSGRFEVNREICLSISGFHEETWQPAWGVRTALVALRSFMMEDAKGQVGGLESSEGTRKAMAGESGKFRCPGCGGRSNEDILKEQEELADAMEKEGKLRKEEEKVPEELKLGYREDIERKEGTVLDSTSSATSIIAGEMASIAENPPAAAPLAPEAPSDEHVVQVDVPPTADIQLDQPPTPRAPQLQPATIATSSTAPQVPAAPQADVQRPPLVQALRPLQAQPIVIATPNSWLDLAIVGIAVMLGVMVLRKLLLLDS